MAVAGVKPTWTAFSPRESVRGKNQLHLKNFFFFGLFWLTLGKEVCEPAESQDNHLCQYPSASILQHLEDPFIRERPSVEMVTVLMGWMESKQGPLSVDTNLLAPAALFSESVMLGRIEMHFLRNATPQATAGFILLDLTSTL